MFSDFGKPPLQCRECVSSVRFPTEDLQGPDRTAQVRQEKRPVSTANPVPSFHISGEPFGRARPF